MTKLSKDQAELHKFRTEYTQNVKTAVDIGKEQVNMLNKELQKQAEFFKMQEDQYISTIEDLRKEIAKSKKGSIDKANQIEKMVEMAVEIKQQNYKLSAEKN